MNPTHAAPIVVKHGPEQVRAGDLRSAQIDFGARKLPFAGIEEDDRVLPAVGDEKVATRKREDRRGHAETCGRRDARVNASVSAVPGS